MRVTNHNLDAQSRYIRRDRDWHPPALAPQYLSTTYRSPRHRPIALDSTVADITGPVFGHDEVGPNDHDLLINYAKPGKSAVGERIMVHGRLRDENGRAISGVLMEFWQANAGGRYRHIADTYKAPLDENFGGCGRTITDEDGAYMLRTVKPGPYPWPNGGNDWRPSHIHFSLFGEGFAQRLITQMYFDGDPLIELCPIVATIRDEKAIDQLISRYDPQSTIPMDIRAYRFDITLRGKTSTPFENRLEGN